MLRTVRGLSESLGTHPSTGSSENRLHCSYTPHLSQTYMDRCNRLNTMFSFYSNEWPIQGHCS